jgi:hypothetical protein
LAPSPYKKTLYVRKKGDEFLVMALLKIIRVTKLIIDFLPWAGITEHFQQFPIFRDMRLLSMNVH